MKPHDSSPRRRPATGRERNYFALVGAIILLVVGLPAVLLAFITVAEDLAAGEVMVWDILGKLFGLLVYAVIVVSMLRTFRGAVIQPGAGSPPDAPAFASLDPESPEYQARLDDFRSRQADAVAGSAQVLAGVPVTDPVAGGFLRRRTEEEAESEMAVAAAVYRADIAPATTRRSVCLQGPYVALGLLGWGSLLSAAVLTVWASEPAVAVGDAAMGLLCVPLWFLAVGSASRILGSEKTSQSGFQKTSYRVIRKTWISPGFTQALIGALVLLAVAAMVGLLMWHPPARPGLGLAEGLLASYVGWGSVIALAIAYWSTRGTRPRQS